MAAIWFWIASCILFYTWVAFPLLILGGGAMRQRRRNRVRAELPLPRLDVVIAVHNGSRFIRDKIANTLASDYPSDRLQVIIVSDGSTDDTVSLTSSCANSRVTVIPIDRQVGKTEAQNLAAASCRGDLVVFSNVQTRLHKNCLRLLASRFDDDRVGVAVPHIVWEGADRSTVARSGGLYWRWEQRLWDAESRLGLLSCGPGACLAIRRSLLIPMTAEFGEDVILPLQAVERGFRVEYDPEAIAFETLASSSKAEFNARVRMTVRSLAGTILTWRKTTWLRRPAASWVVLSHKLLRWLTPYWLVVMVLATIFLFQNPVYRSVLVVELLAVGVVVLGSRFPGLFWGLAGSAFSFGLVNVAFGLGVLRAALGTRVRVFKSQDA